jgi:DNA-binding beta-propeller fold protein YncE
MALLAAAMMITTPAFAFDGWHTESVTTIPGKGAGYDYISYDAVNKRVFLGHRGEGLQVFDPATKTVVKTIDGTVQHSSNGAVLVPEMDLGFSENEDGTFTTFKLSTLANVGEAAKIAPGIDAGHYDPFTKHVLFNTEPGKEGAPIMAVDAATQKVVGTLVVPTQKPEGAIADGKGRFYLAGQLESKIFVIDTASMKIVDTFSSPVCGKPTMIEVDTDLKRLFVTCRSLGDKKAALVVFNTETGATVWSAEIGDGSDSLVYDKANKRLFSADGIHATMTVAEVTSADSYKLIESLATYNNLKVVTMDKENQKLYGMVAEGSADYGKKVNLAVSPFNPNTVFPNTFKVITFTK